MTVGYNVLLRNAQLDVITAFVGDNAKLRIYDGARPATGGAVTTLLAEFTFSSPFAPPATNGALSPYLPTPVLGVAPGNATWFRIVKADGATQVHDGSVGVSGADMIISDVEISIGSPLSVSGYVINRLNA